MQRNDPVEEQDIQSSMLSLSLQNKNDRILSRDYEYLKRTSQTSLKYLFTLKDKTINRLDYAHEMDSIKNTPIVCSYADMEYKMSPEINKEWIRLLSEANMSLGYQLLSKKVTDILIERLRSNVFEGCRADDLLSINTMLSLYYLVVKELTEPSDQVLIFTPTYYRFLYTLNDEKRRVIEYELETRRNQDGQMEFWVDFDKLESLFKSNNIKLMVFANPHNPAGKVWTSEELTQLARLISNYNCLVFSDDIFLECMQNPKEKYRSLLKFKEIHNQLIWASSFGKAFNCSSNSFSYAIVPNKEIKQKLNNGIIKILLFPTFAATKLLESCLTVGEQWRINTIRYIQENLQIIQAQFKKRQIEVDVYTLQSGFVAVVDFQAYKWSHTEIKARLQSQNIFPTYFDTCYVNRQKESISSVRVNIAINRSVLMELIDRIQKITKPKL